MTMQEAYNGLADAVRPVGAATLVANAGAAA